VIIGDSQTVRRLLLFRHAKAITFQAGMDDLTRTLVPDRVLVSPSTRTLETWKFTAPAFPSVPEEMTMEGLYEATSDAIIAIIRQTPAAVQSLLV
jgi:phosphohistidine phosphatase SixA